MKLPADKVNAEGVLDVIRQNIKENCPDVGILLSRSIINGISLAMDHGSIRKIWQTGSGKSWYTYKYVPNMRGKEGV